jgi:hypothetical protein
MAVALQQLLVEEGLFRAKELQPLSLATLVVST